MILRDRMAEKFPTDRFDQLPERPERVGVHRAQPRKFHRLKYVGWSALAVVILAGIGIGGLVVIDNGIFNASDDTAQILASVTPTIDPTVPITILNGTPTGDLDDEAAAALKSVGFTVASNTNASQDTIQTSTVYYSDSSFLPVAQAVANALGISTLKQSTQFSDIGSDVTVVIGADFVPAAVG